MTRSLIALMLVVAGAFGVSAAASAESARIAGAVLSADGIGPVRIGMSVAEAEAALGAELPQRGLEGDFQCEELAINGDVNSALLFMAEEGVITRVSIYTSRNGPDRSILTSRGVGLGDNAAAVRAAYGAAVEEVALPYDNPADLYVWNSANRGIRFERNMDGNIWVIHAGGSSIRYDGCP